MRTTEIDGFHTCKLDGGLEYIQENAPFLSEESNQWLTQGYYFWTDNVYFAHIWGKYPPRNGRYAIVKCLIILNRDELLDLVGCVTDSLYFDELIKKFMIKLAGTGSKEIPSVNAVISFYRKHNALPYKAIKAEDNSSSKKIPYITGRNEMFSRIKRQQLCLFEFAADSIVEKNIIHPVEN